MSGVRRKPNYVRSWFDVRKATWKKYIEGKLIEAKKNGLIDEYFKMTPKTIEKEKLEELGFKNSQGEISLQDPDSEGDIDIEDFYSDEEEDNKKFKGVKMGGFGPTQIKVRNGKQNVDEFINGYYERVLKHKPNESKWKELVD